MLVLLKRRRGEWNRVGGRCRYRLRYAFWKRGADLALMLSDRGVAVAQTTLFRRVQAYAAKLEQRVRRRLRQCTGSWRVDETAPLPTSSP